jgi:hypothetical protein
MIKDFKKGDTYLTKENKITVLDIVNNNDYDVFVSHLESLNQNEVAIASTMEKNEVAKIDTTISEDQTKIPWWKFWKRG